MIGVPFVLNGQQNLYTYSAQVQQLNRSRGRRQAKAKSEIETNIVRWAYHDSETRNDLTSHGKSHVCERSPGTGSGETQDPLMVRTEIRDGSWDEGVKRTKNNSVNSVVLSENI